MGTEQQEKMLKKFEKPENFTNENKHAQVNIARI
jgi:hypothetical protein